MDERTPLQEDVQQSHSRIYHLSWDVLSDLMTILVGNIQADGVPQIIVGVQRGGLIPAVMLSHHLGIRTVLALPIRSTTTDAVLCLEAASCGRSTGSFPAGYGPRHSRR